MQTNDSDNAVLGDSFTSSTKPAGSGATKPAASGDRAVAQVRHVYGQLGPQRTALLVGAVAVLVGAFLPAVHVAGILSSVVSQLTLLNAGIAGFLALAIALVLGALPIWRPSLNRRTDVIAVAAAAFCLGGILAANGACSYIAQLTQGSFGAGTGMTFLIVGYLILTYVYARRAFGVESLWGP